MCTRPDDVSDLNALAELSAGRLGTSIGGIYTPRILHCRLMRSFAQFGVNSDRAVGQYSMCGAAAGAQGSRGSSGECG